ncbi:MAG TPA: 2-hydroxyacid dehydrogenase [Stellaceae bacterium]|nr:2-hydroxyacid dehydrogenase [Stellaceae bacterium]
MLRVAFAGTFPASLEQPVRRHLTIPCEIVAASEADILPRLPETEVLVTMGLTAAMGQMSSRLRLVQVPGAGVDRIDRSALPAGALLANAYGHETGIAEYVIGAMLALTREFSRLDKALRRGDWQSQWAIGTPPPPVWAELAGRTVGILGYGRIGQAIARRARAFDMMVCAIRRDVSHSTEDDLTLLGGPEMLDKVLGRSDYVVVSVPASPETIGWIGEAELRLMKPSAFLINVARAEIVDEDALFHALARSTIAGAALDVWYRYPRAPGLAAPATRPFSELPNVMMTPHISGWTDGTLDARARLIAENIRRIAAGETPLNLIAK